MVIDGGEEDENGVGVRRAAGRIGENLFVLLCVSFLFGICSFCALLLSPPFSC